MPNKNQARLTSTDLDQLERMYAEASPGQWDNKEFLVLGDGDWDVADCSLGSNPEDMDDDEFAMACADARFIAKMHNAFPAMCKEIRDLRSKLGVI